MTKAHLQASFLALLAALACAHPARGSIIWLEVGDAGGLAGTAQPVIGEGAITSISGNIAALNDADVYLLFIADPGAFSATTSGQPGTLVDTQLFLFNASSLGVEANDNVSFPGDLRSTLTAGNPFAPTTPGVYLLAITASNLDPVSAGGQLIFPQPAGGVGVVGPTGPGGDQPFVGFNSSGQGTGTYTIALTGAVAVPEPSSFLLAAAGLAAVASCSRWRRREAL